MGKYRGRRTGTYLLFSEDGPGGCRILRRVNSEEGESLVRQRKAREVMNAIGEHVGYQLYALPSNSSRPLPVTMIRETSK